MNILAINDDLMERSVIQQVLEHSNHQVTFVPSMREGWRRLTEEGFRFLIVDASTDDALVHQFVQHVRSNRDLPGHVYILLLIKKGQSGKLVSGLQEGADDYLNKPVAPQELKSRVSLGVRILAMGDTLQHARDELESMAMYDPLTGLLNQQAFHKIAQGELERARRASDGLSIIALDVENFKDINTRYGQEVGDSLLQIVARVIREKCRPYDCIGRWAGDQFTIALPGVVSSDAEKITKRILAGLQASEVTLTDGQALEIELKAGIASSQTINAYAEIDTFIQGAVQALNNARQNELEEFSVVFV